jgi:uncharacterized protein (DUF2336 family)
LSPAASTDSLLALARSRLPADRERLLFGVAELCNVAGGGEAMAAPAVQGLLNSIFMSLVAEAERDIRRRLAEKLASAEWAPPALINVLALDDIEIARPIIASSPVLKDADLVRLLIESTIEHQIEVARRPGLRTDVVAAILENGEPAVLTALAGNTAAILSRQDVARLVQASRRVAALRQPLARHPQLTEDLALQLYVWVGQSLRKSLADRFRLDPRLLDTVLSQAVGDAHGAVAHDPEFPVVRTRDGEREEMERRLIAKLDAAGQLRPGYLLRALRERKLSLFLAALTTLGRFRPEDVAKALDSPRPELLALACLAVGIDRSVFPTLLDLVRELSGGRPGADADGGKRAVDTIGPISPEIAASAFRQAVRAV